MKVIRLLLPTCALVLVAASRAEAADLPLRADQVEFRTIYQELVETDTTLSSGSCTLAAERMAARLKSAGFAAADLHRFVEPDKPREGSLVAVLAGADPNAGSVLLLGHLDVVEARREDWTRDPFKLVEEDGWFYARGSMDMKGLDAIWVDTMIRLKHASRPPRRTLKLALTCGEETAEAFNGADWLVRNQPALIAADFALNEGGGGRLKEDGTRELLQVQVGEKTAQNYLLTVVNPGGHSSRPRPDNAIYELADALQKIRAYAFPLKLTETTRAGFEVRAKQNDAAGVAVAKLLQDPANADARRVAETDVNINSVLHTNCVATRLDAGHASNALAQRATAIVNCRIFPGETVDGTLATLQQVVGDPRVKIEVVPPVRPVASSPPLDSRVVEPMRRLAAKHFPGIPLVPGMSAGATDGRYFGPAKLPVYGIPGIFGDPDGNGTHGLNERVRARSLYEGRDYVFDLVKEYVGAR